MTVGYMIAVIGLGRMGLPLCENFRDKGYTVVGYDILEVNRQHLDRLGMISAISLEELCNLLLPPRHIILMVPAGAPVDSVLTKVLPSLAPGDVIIDAGNSHYHDSARRSALLTPKGIGFLDVGMSGGIHAARHGACLTIGGDRALFEQLEILFKDIAQIDGYMYVGPSGWGHLVKTIHNGIEYGFLQAIAEGIHTIKSVAEQEGVTVDMEHLCKVWGNGSIIASRLLDDAVQALRLLREHHIPGRIGGGTTGQWALQIAREHNVATPVLAAALAQRERSWQAPDFSGEIIAALRSVFGGHEFS